MTEISVTVIHLFLVGVSQNKIGKSFFHNMKILNVWHSYHHWTFTGILKVGTYLCLFFLSSFLVAVYFCVYTNTHLKGFPVSANGTHYIEWTLVVYTHIYVCSGGDRVRWVTAAAGDHSMAAGVRGGCVLRRFICIHLTYIIVTVFCVKNISFEVKTEKENKHKKSCWYLLV